VIDNEWQQESRERARTERRGIDVPVLAWAAYFATGPVVWLPGLSLSMVTALKSILFATAVWTTWTAPGRRRLPPGVIGPIGALALLLSASFGLFQAATRGAAAINLYSLALPFAVLWSFWNLSDPARRLARAAVLAAFSLAALSAVVLFAGIARPEFLSGPSPFGNTAAWISGFGTKSTGWSHGIALFIPFLAVNMLSSNRRSAIFSLIGIAMMFSGQWVVFGRGGLAISTLIVLTVIAIRLRGYLIWFGIALLLLAVPTAILITDSTEPERLYQEEGTAFEDLDDFSSQRLHLVQRGIVLIGERPITGYGFDNDYIPGSARRTAYQVHVTWLRMAMQGGLLFPATFLAIVLTLTLRSVRVLRSYDRITDNLPLLAAVLTIVGGLTSTLVEPSGLVGAFHTSAVWWAAAGAGARLAFDAFSHPSAQPRFWRPVG
jgi:O-antigen ligase